MPTTSLESAFQYKLFFRLDTSGHSSARVVDLVRLMITPVEPYSL